MTTNTSTHIEVVESDDDDNPYADILAEIDAGRAAKRAARALKTLSKSQKETLLTASPMGSGNVVHPADAYFLSCWDARTTQALIRKGIITDDCHKVLTPAGLKAANEAFEEKYDGRDIKAEEIFRLAEQAAVQAMRDKAKAEFKARLEAIAPAFAEVECLCSLYSSPVPVSEGLLDDSRYGRSMLRGVDALMFNVDQLEAIAALIRKS